MGDADHLTSVVTHGFHHVGHLFSDMARNTRIDFVENNSRQCGLGSEQALEREHDTGYFASRRNVGQVLQGLVAVGIEEEGHLIQSLRPGLRQRFHPDTEVDVGHAQLLQA